MGLGAGALIGAIAYELIPTAEGLLGEAAMLFFGLGALVFYGASFWISRRSAGGKASSPNGSEGMAREDAMTGKSIALGSLLDGIPESLVLGMTIATGGGVSVAFLGAVIISNLPESLGATTGMRNGGELPHRIYRLWLVILVLSAVFAGVGYLFIISIPSADGHLAMAFAAGAVLTMLADSMIPEAYREEGTMVGLMVVLGFAIAATLTFLG